MQFLNTWKKFRIDSYLDGFRQSNGEYKIYLKILCNHSDTTMRILDFARSVVGEPYAKYVKTITGFSPNIDDPFDTGFSIIAAVGCIFDKRDDAYTFVNVLSNMQLWPGKSFNEVKAILDRMLSEGNDNFELGKG